MNQNAASLAVFVAAIVSGVVLIVTGHTEIGAPLLAFATGHLAPQPKMPTKEEPNDATDT